MQKSVLVTGGTGFLGVHLARRFLKDGYRVTLFDLAPLDAVDLQNKVSVINGDIRDKKAIEEAIKGHQYVVHAAAALPIQRSKDTIYSVNVDGTKNVLQACLTLHIKKVVFISTTAVYGVPKHLPETETSPLAPIGYYGESKKIAEDLCLRYTKKGLPVNILRPKSFLGPERLGVFELWFEAIYNGDRVYVLGDGNNLYQLLAVSDVADAVLKALQVKISGEIFNIGARDFGTWRHDLGFIIRQAKSKSVITGIPVFPAQIILRILEYLNLSPLSAWHYLTMPVPSYVSIEKAQKKLMWNPQKSNTQLLLESYLWYKKHRKEVQGRIGKTHRVGWNFKILSLITKL